MRGGERRRNAGQKGDEEGKVRWKNYTDQSEYLEKVDKNIKKNLNATGKKSRIVILKKKNFSGLIPCLQQYLD